MKPRFRTTLAACAATVATFTAADAAAQCASLTGLDAQPVGIAGTTRYRVALEASRKNAAIFGAVASAEKVVLPNLQQGSSSAAMIDLSLLYGATKVPTTCGGLVLYDTDMTAGNVAFGFRYGPVSAFYSAGVASTLFTPGGAAGRYIYPPFIGGLGWFYALGAPLIGAGTSQKDVYSITSDYIAGLQLHGGKLVAASAGYIGSKGLYANASLPVIRAFVSSALTENIKQLGYLRAGFDALDWAFPKEAVKAIGSTSIYGRVLRSYAIPEVGAPVAPTKETAARSLVTGHFEQMNIGGHFDIVSSFTVKPKPDLYHLSIGYTPSSPELAWYEQKARIARPYDRKNTEFRFEIGVVKLPDQTYYGVRGGPKFHAAIDLIGVWIGGKLSIRLNDADVLANFPYAYNALHFYFVFPFGIEKPKEE